MLYAVTMDVAIPHDLDPEVAASTIATEKAYSQELQRSGGRYGLVTMCAAGGMAPAIIIERI